MKKQYKKPSVVKMSEKDINVGAIACWQCC